MLVAKAAFFDYLAPSDDFLHVAFQKDGETVKASVHVDNIKLLPEEGIDKHDQNEQDADVSKTWQ